MNNIEATQFVFDQHSFRMTALFWLAACNDGTDLPPDLRDTLADEDLDETLGIRRAHDDDRSTAEVLMDERKLGFLARIETPVPTRVFTGGYGTLGWGMVKEQWLYAETLDGLLTDAAAASDRFIAGRLAELRAKSAGEAPA